MRFLRKAGQGASQKRERRHSRLPDWIALSRKDERSEDGIASADRVRRDAFVSSRASVCSQRWRKRRDSNLCGLSPKRFSSFIPRLLPAVCYCFLTTRIVGKSAVCPLVYPIIRAFCYVLVLFRVRYCF